MYKRKTSFLDDDTDKDSQCTEDMEDDTSDVDTLDEDPLVEKFDVLLAKLDELLSLLKQNLPKHP